MNQPPAGGPPQQPPPRQKPASMATYKRELRKAIAKNRVEPEINFLNITANANIPYQSIIGTCDAIRKADDGQVLFPDITIGVPK